MSIKCYFKKTGSLRKKPKKTNSGFLDTLAKGFVSLTLTGILRYLNKVKQ